MNATAPKGLGRPLMHGEKLERIQLLVRRDQIEAVQAEADKRAKKQGKSVSASEILREWIDNGRGGRK